jgi:ethanolamine utilization protein EutA
VKTRQLLSVGIDIGTTTTQVIFSRLELVNRAAVSQVPRYEFIKREISWQSPVFFTPVDKQGGLKEAELKALILAQYQAAGVAPESVDSGAIIITGESAKTRNARPAVMALSQSLGDFVVASAGPHLESVIAGHGAGAQPCPNSACAGCSISISAAARRTMPCLMPAKSAAPPASTLAAACWKPTARGAWSMRISRDR